MSSQVNSMASTVKENSDPEDFQPCIANNRTDPFNIGVTYGGLPVNLLTNVIGWTVLMILFLLLRKKSALRAVSRKVVGRSLWLEAFFVRHTDTIDGDVIYDSDIDLPAKEALTTTTTTISGTPSFYTKRKKIKKGIKIFTAWPQDLEELMGNDAVQFLRFQLFLMSYLLFCCIIACCIVLPVNLQGTLQGGNSTDFGHTTIANLDPKDEYENKLLWIHISFSFLLFPVVMFLMRKFSMGLEMQDISLDVCRTLAIEHVPRSMCTKENIMEHFREIYPTFKILDVQIAFDVEKLTKLCDKLKNVKLCLRYSKSYKKRNKEELKIRPKKGARCCFCFCIPCVETKSCIEYYSSKVEKLEKRIQEQREKALQTKLGIVFVTFESINHARQVHRDYQYSMFNCQCPYNPPASSIDLKPEKLSVWYAPLPADLIWTNLSDKRSWLFAKKIISNSFIFIIAFFFTTPQIVLHHLNVIFKFLHINTSRNGTSRVDNLEDLTLFPVWLTDFIPTLIIWIFTAALPAMVAYAEIILGHWTRSGMNHALMKKSFMFLILMVILLPTFGFTSGQAIIEFLLRNFNDSSDSKDKKRWECIFLPDSGAFFVNYVITASLIGTGLELIRFPELFMYFLEVLVSKSKADTPAIQRAITYEFRFGEQYARMMLLFAMVVVFSISCPLITPFGLFYFLMKHIVDRHNLAYVYAPSKISKRIHATAIHMVVISVALLQFLMVVFTLIRSGDIEHGIFSLHTKVALGLFVLTLNICSAQLWYRTCKKISPIRYEDVLLADRPHEDPPVYIPDVLKVKSHQNSKNRHSPEDIKTKNASECQRTEDVSVEGDILVEGVDQVSRDTPVKLSNSDKTTDEITIANCSQEKYKVSDKTVLESENQTDSGYSAVQVDELSFQLENEVDLKR